MIHRTRYKSRLSYTIRVAAICCLSAFTTATPAALLNLADAPLYLLTTVDPNILLTFDDSGSMTWGFLPDGVHFGGPGAPPGAPLDTSPRGCASNINYLAYDPTITYIAGVDKDGVSLGNASFTAAWFNGFDLTAAGAHQGTTVNLATAYQMTWSADASVTTLTYVADCSTGTWAGQPAYYYVYDTSLCADPTNDACYRLKQHNNPTAWSATDQQNFANWYSYYRLRNLLAKAAIGRAFSTLGGNVRTAAQHLNNIAATLPDRFTTAIGLMKAFSGTDRADFYTRLYNTPANNATPLREALQRAGDYFSITNNGASSPYRDVPGVSTSPERSCRKNFNILLTDGYWNGTAGLAGNFDGNAFTLGDGTGYTPMPPYQDTTAATLADNGFYYWAKDLRTDLTNNVKPFYTDTTGTATVNYWNAKNDPATWQHLVNYSIGLGIDGTLPNTTATYNNLVSGATAWPAAVADTPSAVDDLWHTAVNSRGQYFSARNPTTLSTALSSILNSIASATSSAAAVAVNSGTVSSSSFVYQSSFNSGNWGGQIFAYPINPDGSVSSTFGWEAGQKLALKNFAARNIFTYKTATATASRKGIPFAWPGSGSAAAPADELEAAQINWLNYNPVSATADSPSQAQARLNYLRGDASNEGALGNMYRARFRACSYVGASTVPVACPAGTNTGALGDTVDSAPLYVGRPPFAYTDPTYTTFRTTYASRTPMVYVGSNDGMLHGFNATTGTVTKGTEEFAYIPGSVYPNLSRLTSPSYSHRYFVDGDPIAGDVDFNAPSSTPPGTGAADWRTVLVSTLRKGGQGVFALDITDPTKFSQSVTNAASLALWEFTDADDKDLGYTFSQPTIVKMADGRWAAIIGNGYNNTEADGNQSTTGDAVLYILFIKAGVSGWTTSGNFIKIDTGVGITGTNTTPNGLATPTAVDVDNDGKVDFIYAGDLRGNLWKFDVTSTNPSQWSSASNRKILYTAKDGLGNLQPITSRPTVGTHPTGLAGYMVYFGTGKYLETTDATSSGATTQTFYGIWDDINNLSGVASPTRSNLLQQTIVLTPTLGGSDYRVISNNTMVWRASTPAPSPSYVGWYLDLPTTGERQVTNPVLHGGRVIFTTVIPSSDPCNNGGEGWLMELSTTNGGRLDITPFDTNGDGKFDGNDLVTLGSSKVATGGTRFKTGIPSSPVIMNGGPGPNPACLGGECKFISSSDGKVNSVNENPDNSGYVRESWRQLR